MKLTTEFRTLGVTCKKRKDKDPESTIRMQMAVDHDDATFHWLESRHARGVSVRLSAEHPVGGFDATLVVARVELVPQSEKRSSSTSIIFNLATPMSWDLYQQLEQVLQTEVDLDVDLKQTEMFEGQEEEEAAEAAPVA